MQLCGDTEKNAELKHFRANQFYVFSLKSQSYCLSGFNNLYNEQHPLSLDPWKKLQEEPQRRGPQFWRNKLSVFLHLAKHYGSLIQQPCDKSYVLL